MDILDNITEEKKEEKKEEIMVYELTNDISLLPNNPNSVWYNAIMVALLFSDKIRSIIKKGIKRKDQKVEKRT